MSSLSIPSSIPSAAEVEPVDTHDHDEPELEHVSIGTKMLNAVAIILPFLGLVLALVLMWGWGVTWFEVTMLLVGYLLTAGGVTLGYHRYFTHKSYETTRFMQWIIGACATMSMQGTLLGWVATHRCHHQHSDRPGDPHSPHVDHHHENIGGGLKGLIKGYWHSHMGWLFNDDPVNLVRYIPDLKDDVVAKTLTKLFAPLLVLSIIIPGVLGGLWHGSWWGVLLGVLWGGAVRIFMCHHVTWSINSACHLWGARTYKSHDHSRNNVLFGVLALGEGWHNNHHAFPASARHGLEWWQFDLTYITIWCMKKVGLAWDVKIPPKERREAKKVRDAVVGPHGQPITYTPRNAQ